MELLLPGLLADLERRCASLQAILIALPDQAFTAAHVLESYQVLELAKRDASGLLAEPTLGERALMGNYLRLFQRLAERVRLVEWMVMPFVIRFDAGDRFLTRLVATLVAECAIPARAPLVGGLSNMYYWTFPVYSVIGVPAGEVHSLLGLPDLCHELGHILLHNHEDVLVGDFPSKLALHVSTETARFVAEQRPPDYVSNYVAHFERWADEWLLEFVSDVVATYLAGPAYGLQHVRLCAAHAESVYYPAFGEDSDHPADRARLDGVVTTLVAMGDESGAELVSGWWRDFVSIGGEAEPSAYRQCYPAHLLDALAKAVVDGCKALGIRPYSDATDGSLVRRLLDAWDHFRNDPGGYPEYERLELARLRKLFDA